MDAFRFPIQLRWADMDPNFHLRHDAYYAIGAQARVEALLSAGITTQRMQAGNFGPILFREECVFKREIRMGDDMGIHLWLSKARPDGSRWTFHHEFVRGDGTVCAVLTTDGAWIDTNLRKVTAPPQEHREPFLGLPRTDDFEMLPLPAPKVEQG